ncbi:spore-associated protein A [Actinoallomurus purpureus]|uniref:spore-associated protein A n=1 Tax=Actinoallomurus purpureus TaxID=478114 RepID=UPI00209319A1|nr:spore-associated protein A [Actinoallomurus purpureus]MCO6010093.1 spore-associated protein A [Actinoallomurus purpureus]
MRKFNKGAVLALAGAAAVAGSVAVSTPAMAASSPIAACGGGSYHVIDTHDLGAATIYLMYNGSTNCVVTWKDSSNSTSVEAWLRRQSDGKIVYDVGNYSTYAGPVRLSAAGSCIGWGGHYGSTQWISDWSHCG